ncbi:sugar 3,4-ketoisomerase [Coralliovum pocilloporae]|uniref:sugar 3,4-ketoisomerase n=1 Tax=Coralliovum pocilloporae TaxID=3066369 RepID=UPI00330778B2
MTDCESKKAYLIELKTHTDSRGNLSVGQIGDDWDFEIRRVYYQHGLKEDKQRGNHAHKALHQVMIVVSGSCTVLTDDGKNPAETWHLDTPTKALRIKPGVWRVLENFSEDAVVLVLASEVYDPDDYIHDYDAFRAYISEQNED